MKKLEIILKKEPEKFGGNPIIVFRKWEQRLIETFCIDGHQEICWDYFCKLKPIKPEDCEVFLKRFKQIYHDYDIVTRRKLQRISTKN